MNGLIKSFQPIFERYKIEAFLLFSSLTIAIISGFIFVLSQSRENEELPILEPVKTASLTENKILVDLSGAVERADVYEISSGARLKDVLILAGGLSAEADRQFFARNFNLARVMKDQEKIYIPNTRETQNGETAEIQQSLANIETNTLGATEKISINTASLDQLDSLPGIGKVTAQKIIQNRPYQSIDEFLNKKVVGKSLFEKIKDLIQI